VAFVSVVIYDRKQARGRKREVLRKFADFLLLKLGIATLNISLCYFPSHKLLLTALDQKKKHSR
jgi:hypothetical protein